jgi:hypothetical protein
MAIGGHPDHGLSGVAGQHSAGTGMESAYGGPAIGVPGGAPAGQNAMGAFLDAMTQRYGPQSVKNFVDNYLSRQQARMDDAIEHFRGPFPPGGRRAFGGMPYGASTAVSTAVQDAPVVGTVTEDYGVPPGAMANPSPTVGTPTVGTPMSYGSPYRYGVGMDFQDVVMTPSTPVGAMDYGKHFASYGTNLENYGLGPAQIAALDAAYANTDNFTNFEAYADPSVLADAMPAPNYGPQYGGGGDQFLPPRNFGELNR